MIPIIAQWSGEAFVPMRRFMRRLEAELAIGTFYRINEEKERSLASHKFYFAQIAEVWKSLPDDLAEQYPSPESLRKRALIQAGYYDQEVIDCESEEVAERVCSAIRKRDDFALVFVRGSLVIVREAKSQSMKAMGRKEFEASKTKVLDILADLIKVEAKDIPSEAAA